MSLSNNRKILLIPLLIPPMIYFNDHLSKAFLNIKKITSDFITSIPYSQKEENIEDYEYFDFNDDKLDGYYKNVGKRSEIFYHLKSPVPVTHYKSIKNEKGKPQDGDIACTGNNITCRLYVEEKPIPNYPYKKDYNFIIYLSAKSFKPQIIKEK